MPKQAKVTIIETPLFYTIRGIAPDGGLIKVGIDKKQFSLKHVFETAQRLWQEGEERVKTSQQLPAGKR
jgi:hypothetical protein